MIFHVIANIIVIFIITITFFSKYFSIQRH